MKQTDSNTVLPCNLEVTDSEKAFVSATVFCCTYVNSEDQKVPNSNDVVKLLYVLYAPLVHISKRTQFNFITKASRLIL